VADEKAVTFVPDEDASGGALPFRVGSVVVYSEDGEESQTFQAGVPVVSVPSKVLSRIEGAKGNQIDGYKFEVVKPSTAESRHGAPQAGEGA
jgi:hypothetical protein